MGIIAKVEQKLHLGGSSKNLNSGAAPTHGEISHNTAGKDRNHDGIPDKLEGKGLGGRDRDHDGIPDKLEGKGVGGRDRDHDGIPDKLEHGRNKDRDHDGIPDKLEHGRNKDRDHDGIPDRLEGRGAAGAAGVAGGAGLAGRDRDHDGIPDSLEGRSNVVDTTYERVHQAPVVKETVRDEYVHNIQPVIQKEHDKTDIIKTVQPLKDSEITDTRVHTKQRADQFREIGQDERIARETEEKLRLHREEVARQGGRTHLEDTHTFTENAPQVHHTERRHVIEEVQPVIERDVLRPHVVEETQNVFVHEKEAAVLKEVRVAPVMSVAEWERTQAAKGETVTGAHGLGGVHDRNHDGIPDKLQHGTHGAGVGGVHEKDRNHDGIPDKLQHGKDRNHDGIPDKLQKDRNHDGIPDNQQRALDLNGDGKVSRAEAKMDRDHDGDIDAKDALRK